LSRKLANNDDFFKVREEFMGIFYPLTLLLICYFQDDLLQGAGPRAVIIAVITAYFHR
jgi:hypothetical protein